MRNLALLSAVVFLLTNMAIASSADAAGCGTAEVVKGTVEVAKGGAAAVPLAQGDKVCAGDVVKTSADSRAKLVMEDSNVLNINPGSAIKIEAYENDPSTAKKKVLLNVMYGKMRATVNQKYDGKAANGEQQLFQVKTKSAVAGVRGTDFLTSFSSKSNKMEVVTFHGKVEVGQAGPGGAITNGVSVSAGQKTEATVGQPPAPPKPVPPSELKQMEKSSDAGPPAKGGDSATNSGGENKEEKKDDKKEAKQDEKKGEDKKAEDKKEAKQDEKKSDEKKDAKQEDKKDSKQAGKDDKKSDGDKKGSEGGDKKSSGDKSADGGKKGSEGGDKSSSGKGGAAAGGGTASTGGDGGSTGSTATRQPASDGSGTVAGPAPGGMAPPSGGMLPPPPPPVAPPLPSMPTFSMPTLPPPVYVPPTCDFCNSAVQNGPAKVNIKICVPGANIPGC